MQTSDWLILKNEVKKPKASIFMFHAGNGQYHFFNNIIAILKDDYNCYIIKPFSDMNIYLENSLETISTIYFAEIRKKSEEVILIGHCNGGFFAYEVAKKMDSINRKIKLILIETSIFNTKGYHKSNIFNFCIGMFNIKNIPYGSRAVYFNRRVKNHLIFPFLYWYFYKFKKKKLPMRYQWIVPILSTLVEKYEIKNWKKHFVIFCNGKKETMYHTRWEGFNIHLIPMNIKYNFDYYSLGNVVKIIPVVKNPVYTINPESL